MKLADTTRVGCVAMESYYLTNESSVQMAMASGSVADSSTEWTAANAKAYTSTTGTPTGTFDTRDWGIVYPSIGKMNDLRCCSGCIEITYEGDITKATGSVTVTHMLSDHAASYASIIGYMDNRTVKYDNLLLNAFAKTFPVSKLLNGAITIPMFPISPKAFEYGTNSPASVGHSDAIQYDVMIPLVFITGCTENIRFTVTKNFEYVPEMGVDQTPFAKPPPPIEHTAEVKNAFQRAVGSLGELSGTAHYSGQSGLNPMTELWSRAGSALMDGAIDAAGNVLGGLLMG